MEGKNLPLKFIFLVLAVVLCVIAMFTKGLKQGIDLRGGHSLTFEIYTTEARQKKLEQNKADLEAQLKQASTDDKKKELEDAIKRIDQDIKTMSEGDPADLVNQMISILKRRVDPQGLRNLEWRPQGQNRFEVRMPAGREESRRARKDYDRALEQLESRNLRRSQITRIEETASRAQRQTLIASLAGDDKQLAGQLAALGKAYDSVNAAKAGGNDEIYQIAVNEWEKQRDKVAQYNLSRQKIQGILKNYLTASEAEALKKVVKNKKEIERRKKVFLNDVDELIAKYSTRRKEIEKVVECHKTYAEVRQFLDDPADLIRLIAKAGVLEYRIAPEVPGVSRDKAFRINDVDFKRYITKLHQEGPEGSRKRNESYQWFLMKDDGAGYGNLVVEKYAGQWYILLCNQSNNVMLQQRGQGGWSLKDARVTRDSMNTPAVGFTFNERGARLFGQLTLAHKDHHMAVLLDDEVYSAPVIQSVITHDGIITGKFTPDEARDLARTLKAGSLPARLNPVPVSESTFGPAIGAVNREMGIKAAYAGIIAVALFMLIYYLSCGFIADVALVLNVVLVLGVMSLFDVVFTLPGIAGLILTVGIAVDANVLIFERLREEQLRNQSVKMALKNAYQRAFSAIFDANITTMITCMILGWVGTEEVRGFGIVLGLGVAFSMFTALVVTRWIFQLLLALGMLKKPLFMLHIIGIPKINWMGKRKIFWVISSVMIIMGISSLVIQGGDIWGIEFSSGTKAIIRFKDDALIDGKLPNDKLVRDRFEQVAGELGYDKLKATARVEMLIDANRVEKFLEKYDRDNDGSVSQAEWKADKTIKAEFFTVMDADGNKQLSKDELERLNLSYQVTTTEIKVARIKEVAERGFGDSLQRRTSCMFEMVKGGRVAELDMDMPLNGMGRVSVTDGSHYRDIQQDFEEGLVIVVDKVSPAQTVKEIVDRLRVTQSQADFAQQQSYMFKVVGLKETEADKYGKFAIFFQMPEDENIGWNDFAANSLPWMNASLKRAEAMEVINFDPAIAGDTAGRAIFAVVASWIAIVLYLWFRFGSPQWGLAAVICLIHDVIIAIGLVAATGWIHNTFVGEMLGISSFKIDLAMIAAILTVIGYSVNDTIVVFDRIRENRGKLSTVSSHVINSSINQTLSRTLLTSGTTFIVVLIMYVWGGPGMHAFNYILLAGIIFGTYSSIAVASPLLLGFKQALVAKITNVSEE